MNNFIEIKTENSQVFLNLNFIVSIHHTQHCSNDRYCVYLAQDKYYKISKEEYEAIKAKLIDNKAKE